MITNFAELLSKFIEKEIEYLDAQQIQHSPTIGRMYEGLTRDLLSRSIPEEWDLNVTEGFITNEKGMLSNQIDCMLAIGEGERIPYTESYKYNIDNVIAVLEIKKTLYSQELADAYANLRSVYGVIQPKEINREMFDDAYISILSEFPPPRSELKDLPIWKSEIYRALVLEDILPVRIALGYHGFSSERNFRNAFIDYLNKHVGEDGFGPNSLPNLLVSDTYCIVKLNGMPYSSPIIKDNLFWHVLASYAGNFLVILLELLWTKITYRFNYMVDGYSNDLSIERLKPLLIAKAVEKEGSVGWEYINADFSDSELSSVPLSYSWEPVELSDLQAEFISRLINFEEISVQEEWFQALIAHPDYSSNTIEDLIANRLIFEDKGIYRLLTRQCAIVAMPDGSIVAGENNSGRLETWVKTQMIEKYGKNA